MSALPPKADTHERDWHIWGAPKASDYASTMTIAARSHEAPGHRAGMLAALEDRRAGRKRCFIAIDPLHEAPAVSRHVVHELGLVQPQTVEVDQVDVGAQARRQPAAVGQTEEVGGLAGLPLDQMLERQASARGGGRGPNAPA